MNSNSRIRILPVFIIMLAGTVALHYGLSALQTAFAGNRLIYDFGTLMSEFDRGSLPWIFLWAVTDIAEGSFTGTLLSGILMTIGCLIGAHLERKKSPYAGTGIDGQGKIFTHMAVGGFAGLLLGGLIFNFFGRDGGFVPTFAAFLAIGGICIARQPKNALQTLTIVVCITLTSIPVCVFLKNTFVAHFGLPLLTAVALANPAAAVICTELFFHLPWMNEKPAASEPESDAAPVPAEAPKKEMRPSAYFIHRVFGDYGEMIFWGSSIGAMMMTAGAVISVILNPSHPAFDMALMIPLTLFTLTVADFVWFPVWQKEGWVPIFTTGLFICAIAATYPLSLPVIIPSIAIAVFFVPWFMRLMMSRLKIARRWPPICFALIATVAPLIPWGLFISGVLT